jgi:hypothetical protein
MNSKELTTTNNNTGPTTIVVHQSNNALVMKLQGKVIRTATPLELATVVSACVEKARFDLCLSNDNITTKDLSDFKDAIISEIKTFFYTLTLEEIAEVFHRGTRGKFTDDGKVFLTVANVSQWFAKYMMMQERLEAKIELKRLSEPPPYVPTEEEQEQMRLKFIADAYAKYKAEGVFDDWYNKVFEAIEKYRTFNFTLEEKIAFGKTAKQNLIENASRPARNLAQQQKNRAFAQAVIEGHAKTEVAIEAKKIALCEQFRRLAEENIDITAWLQQHEY